MISSETGLYRCVAALDIHQAKLTVCILYEDDAGQELRTLRLISRQMQKLTGILSSEKNRMHKVLTDGGVRLAVVVSDIHGKSAREMIKGLSRGETPEQVLQYASKRLKANRRRTS